MTCTGSCARFRYIGNGPCRLHISHVLQSPEVHSSPSNHRPRISTRLRITAAAQQRPGPCSSIWKTAKINVNPTHNTRLCSMQAGMQQYAVVCRLACACCLQCRYSNRVSQPWPHRIRLVPRFPRHHAIPRRAAILGRLRYDFTVNLISKPSQVPRGSGTDAGKSLKTYQGRAKRRR